MTGSAVRRVARFCAAAAAIGSVWLAVFVGPAKAMIERYDSRPLPPNLQFQETPSLAEAVAQGQLPPVQQRLPALPHVVLLEGDQEPGRAGGVLRTLVNKAKDTRLLAVYGYARLIGFDRYLNLVPDILSSVEVHDGRSFTLRLRPGHRWSDGHPFTSADFRFFWEKVANDPQISPTGPPRNLLVEGEAPKVEFPDALTVRYSWSKPNPFFLTHLAGARPLYIYQPAHYMKQFHADYADADALAAAVKAAKKRNWAALYNSKDQLYRFNNPALPTLQPWLILTSPPSQRFVAKRNPYFHRVDAEGQQLPYIDEVILQVAGGSLIPAKSGAGDSDLQARGLSFSDYTFLKAAEERSGYGVKLWRTVRGSQVALYPNLTVEDPVWRKLLRDARFRQALSLAIDRHELNQVIYFGLGLEGNQSILPGSDLYKPSYRKSYAEFDPAAANRLLDEIGLTARNDDGLRLLPDGRPLEIIIETAGENGEEIDMLELIHDSWLQAGIKLYSKPSQREVLRNRIFAGQTLISMWFGYENAVPTAQMSPEEFTPTRQHSFHWPKWGQHFETSGKAGEAIDMPLPQELLELYHAWRNAGSRGEQESIWHRILEIHAEQVYTLGLVAQIPQPVVVAKGLRNVPDEAIFNWDPGAQFGIYHPDTFWFDR